MEHRLNTKEGLEEDYLSIIQDYWQIDNSEFVNRPKQIIEKYNISQSDLNRIIKDNSECIVVQGHCISCGLEISKSVFSQTSFKEAYIRSKNRCSQCESEYFKKIEADKAARLELEINERKEKFKDSIEKRKWENLNAIEFDILKKIVRLKDKNLIRREVFKNNFYDEEIWKYVNRIEKLKLISITRGLNNYIISFDFSPELERHILTSDNEFLSKELDYLSFSISMNSNKKTIRQPDYSGTFILKRDIRLKAEQKYIYGGWINSDGSINLKFQPIDSLNPTTEQKSVDNEPTHIKNLLNDFFNEIQKQED